MPFAPTAGERARAALKDAQHTPYWLAQPERPAPRPPLDPPELRRIRVTP